jgi:GGDEF domain-containing protein
MQTIAVGFWGAFFGSALFASATAILAFSRSAPRVAFTGVLSAMLPAVYALAFLDGVLLADPEQLQRLRALTAIACAAVLVVPLLMLLGVVRRRNALATARWLMLGAAIAASLLAAFVPPLEALVVGIVVASLVGVAGIAVSARIAWKGEPSAWVACAALASVCIGMWFVDWMAVHPEGATWQLHALSALAGMTYLMCIAAAMWTRYAYLIDVMQVMRQGPGYDPVTRLRIWELGAPAPGRAGIDSHPVGVIAVCIANLKALEELHGRAAYNHALFVCASRLRRLSLPAVEIVRAGEEGFVLVLRRFSDVERLVDLARTIEARLGRPVRLGTGGDIGRIEEEGALWEAAVGVGLLVERSQEQLDITIAGARAMARTAWSFGSRIAWFDEAAQAIAELPRG